jgi:hypothetical protein
METRVVHRSRIFRTLFDLISEAVPAFNKGWINWDISDICLIRSKQPPNAPFVFLMTLYSSC